MGTFCPRLSGMVSILNHLIYYSHKLASFSGNYISQLFFSHLNMLQVSFFMHVSLKLGCLSGLSHSREELLDRGPVTLWTLMDW